MLLLQSCTSGGPSNEGKPQGPRLICDSYCHHHVAFIRKSTGHFISKTISMESKECAPITLPEPSTSISDDTSSLSAFSDIL